MFGCVISGPGPSTLTPRASPHSYETRDQLRTLHRQIDNLCADVEDCRTARVKCRLEKKLQRLRARCIGLQNHMHYSLLDYIFHTSDIIVIGAWDGSAAQSTARLGSSTKRDLAGLAWGRFMQRLAERSVFFPHVKVVVLHEAYTSKWVMGWGSGG